MTDRRTFLRALAATFDQLKVDGIGIYTNDNQGRRPGDPHFEPMWQELNRRHAIVYMHPLAPTCCSNLKYAPALFGTDYSPEPIESVNELPGLKLSREFELALLRGNAERLFPKFTTNARKIQEAP